MGGCCKFKAQKTTKKLLKQHLFWTIFFHVILNAIINGMSTAGYSSFASVGTYDQIKLRTNLNICAPVQILDVINLYFWLLVFSNIQGLYLFIHLIANICHNCAKMKNCCSPFCCKYPDTPQDCKQCWQKKKMSDQCCDYCQVFDPCGFCFVWFQFGLDFIILIVSLALFGPIDTVNKYYSNTTSTVSSGNANVTSWDAFCGKDQISKDLKTNFTNVARPNVYGVATIQLIYLGIMMFFVIWGCCIIVERRRKHIKVKLAIKKIPFLGSSDSSSSDEQSERYQGKHKKGKGGVLQELMNGSYMPTMYSQKMPAQPLNGQVQAPQQNGYPAPQSYPAPQAYPPQQPYPPQGYAQPYPPQQGYPPQQNGKGMMVQNNGYHH